MSYRLSRHSSDTINHILSLPDHLLLLISIDDDTQEKEESGKEPPSALLKVGDLINRIMAKTYNFILFEVCYWNVWLFLLSIADFPFYCKQNDKQNYI